MAKSKTKNTKRAASTRKAQKLKNTIESETNPAETVGYLLELHNLQGVLLTQLERQVK